MASHSESSVEPTSTKPNCVFCNVSEERGFKIVLQEGNVVVFRDRPAAQEHLLVVPLTHIDGVKVLSAEHIPLMQEMEAAGHRALDKLSDAYPREKRVLGFHIPPLTMIKHLHLHTMVLPYNGFVSKMLYPVSKGSTGNSKGYSFFVTSSQAIEIIQKGRTITLSPC